MNASGSATSAAYYAEGGRGSASLLLLLGVSGGVG